jgi:hypothetical protein
MRNQPLVYGAALALGGLMWMGCSDDAEPGCDPDAVCGADASNDGGTDGGLGGDGSSSDAADGSAPLPTCEAGTALSLVTGTVLDNDGNVLPSARAQLCLRLAPNDRLVCLRPDEVDEAGQFEIVIPPDASCVNHAVLRAFSTEDSSYASLFCEVGLEGVELTALTLASPYTLWATAPATSRAPRPAEDTELGTIIVEGDLEIDVRPSALGYGPHAYDVIAASPVDPASEGLCFLPDDVELYGLWAFAPESNVNDELFRVRFPNTEGLNPGTIVQLYILGGLDTTTSRFGGLVPEGEWEPFGRARVDDSGDFLESAQGMPAFTWWGYGPADL